MIESLNSVFRFSITLEEVILNLFVAFLCGVIIAIFYRTTYTGPGYSTTFVNAMVLLSMITAVVIMVIGNNLARAFGLVGAMSIIRFRTAVKDTNDIIYIFFSLAIGMAAGVGFHSMAIVGTLFVGFISFGLTKIHLKSLPKREYLLQFMYTGEKDSGIEAYSEVLNKFCKYYKLVNVKSIGENDDLELSFYIRLKNPDLSANFIQELKQIPGIQHANLFFDEEFF